MGNWGKTVDLETLRPSHPLMVATRRLSTETRAKIYAVITRGDVMHKGTWNGCVFNKITNLKNAQSVATILGEPVDNVIRFIRAWDNIPLSDIQGTVFLSKLLQQVGIVKETPAPDDRKVIRVRLYTSDETKAVEELRAEIDSGAFDELLSEVNALVSC